jgi:hypothetical protein
MRGGSARSGHAVAGTASAHSLPTFEPTGVRATATSGATDSRAQGPGLDLRRSAKRAAPGPNRWRSPRSERARLATSNYGERYRNGFCPLALTVARGPSSARAPPLSIAQSFGEQKTRRGCLGREGRNALAARSPGALRVGLSEDGKDWRESRAVRCSAHTPRRLAGRIHRGRRMRRPPLRGVNLEPPVRPARRREQGSAIVATVQREGAGAREIRASPVSAAHPGAASGRRSSRGGGKACRVVGLRFFAPGRTHRLLIPAASRGGQVVGRRLVADTTMSPVRAGARS